MCFVTSPQCHRHTICRASSQTLNLLPLAKHTYAEVVRRKLFVYTSMIAITITVDLTVMHIETTVLVLVVLCV